ncbi:uncharacterized protein BJX67DRAFT_359088 [Aspergillus lucknowensis]|uniref:AA1-like domain-containing protein n=1 Tax=Aspergillus lucknowensis TaxID=176173 RepID=A0ABR4LL68_9EURO
MKTSFVAVALSLFGAALAAPSTEVAARQNSQYPYSIGGLSLKRLENDQLNLIFSATRYSDAGEALLSTTCQTSWNPSLPAGPENPQACKEPSFSFFFPSGAGNLEDFELTLAGPAGTVRGEIASGPKYACGDYDGTIEGVIFECKTTNGGEFFFPLV